MNTCTIGVDTSERTWQTKGTKGLEKRWEEERDNEVIHTSCAEKTSGVLYLFVSLQLLHEGPLVEESVQALLRVVVA